MRSGCLDILRRSPELRGSRVTPRRGGRPEVSRTVGLIAAATALAVIFVSSGSPIPLYNVFRVEDGLTDADLALATVAYIIATSLALLVVGRLSNYLGRKPVAVASVLFALGGMLLMMTVHSFPVLLAARVLQGAACGVATSALGSWIVDLASNRPSWLPALLTGTLPPFTLPVGGLVSGALAEYGPAPRVLMFMLVAIALAVLAALLCVSPETVRPAPGALASLIPRVHIPHRRGRALVGVGSALLATWAFSGSYQAFAAAIAADYLGTSDRFVIALVFSSVVILSPVGGLMAGALQGHLAVRIGIIGFLVGAVGAASALRMGVIAPFLFASYLVGIASGMVSAGGIGILLRRTKSSDRAGMLATIYLICYGGQVLPGLVSSQLSRSVGVPNIILGYVALGVVLGAFALVLLQSERSERG